MVARVSRWFRNWSPAAWCGLGLWLLFVAINPGRNQVTDTGNRLEVTRALWTEGRVSVPSPPQTPGDWFPTRDGRVVRFYGMRQSLLMIPFDMVGARLAKAAHLEPPRDKPVTWLPVGLVLLPLLGVLWWRLLRRVLEEVGCTPAWAVAGAALVL